MLATTAFLEPARLTNYTVLEAVANGQFGKVSMAIRDGKMYALKQVLKQSQDVALLGRETLIHRNLVHPNIIRLFEDFYDGDYHYLIMEYAAGGELFDKILPDVGVDEELAHFYFCQLIDGVEFMHSRGVAHRDLKPENLLLDDRGNLKICDFGLSTVFRPHKGEKRRLFTVCGTKPYIAPEVLFGDYDGEAIDIWSCGIILYVLLLGNTPWDEPTDQSPEFCQYIVNEQLQNTDPWYRLRPEVYALIRDMCQPWEQNRFNLSQIKNNEWVQRVTSLRCSASSESAALDRLLSQMNIDETDNFASQMDTMMSQQQTITNSTISGSVDSNPGISFSQPLEYIGAHGYQQNHINFSQPDKNRFSCVSRFYTTNRMILHEIANVLTDFLVTFSLSTETIQFNTVDRRKCPLSGEIRLQSIPQNLNLVHFRRIKGDPLEFRRLYMSIKEELADYVCSSQNY